MITHTDIEMLFRRGVFVVVNVLAYGEHRIFVKKNQKFENKKNLAVQKLQQKRTMY